MSDRYHARLEIGGPIPPHLLPELITILQAGGLLYGADKITSFVNPRGTLEFEDDQAPYGQFPDPERWLEQHSIEFNRHSSGWFDTSPVSVHLRRDLGLVERLRDEGGHVLVRRDEIVAAMKSHASLDDVLTALRCIVGPDIPPLQPVNLSPDLKEKDTP